MPNLAHKAMQTYLIRTATDMIWYLFIILKEWLPAVLLPEFN